MQATTHAGHTCMSSSARPRSPGVTALLAPYDQDQREYQPDNRCVESHCYQNIDRKKPYVFHGCRPPFHTRVSLQHDRFSSTSARIMPQVGYPLRRSVPLAEARNISENRYTLFGIML